MVGTKYVDYEGRLTTKTITAAGIVEDETETIVERSNLSATTDSARSVTLAPGANHTFPLPAAPCIIQLQAHRHEDDPVDETWLKTDAMAVMLSGILSGSLSEIGMLRYEGDTAAGLTVTAPVGAGDSITVRVRAEGIEA